jgi:hypothetical protein
MMASRWLTGVTGVFLVDIIHAYWYNTFRKT